MEQKTPLYQCHVDAGGKIVSFGGFLLPVQYSGVIKEHMAVRTACGLFDVSHMGEIIIKGQDALANVQNIVCNDISSLKIGRIRYSPVCNEQGGIVDDILIYKLDEDEYLLVVNAANRQKDFQWIKEHFFGKAELKDVSNEIAQLALQGPNAEKIMAGLTDADGLPVKYYSFVRKISVAGIDCLVSRTGYTGEDGFELYCAAEKSPSLWAELLTAGEEYGLIPCGLGARDTLRLEAAMPLYGHEMNDQITPYQTGLGRYVKMDKSDFIGKKSLQNMPEADVCRVGLQVTGRGIAREHFAVFAGGKQIGETTSGTHCPFVNAPIAMAIIDKNFSAIGTEVEVEIRGRMVEAKVVELPFYKRA